MPVLDTIERTTIRYVAVEARPPLLTCTPADPFEIDHDCRNPAGHDFQPSCGYLACVHCGRVAW